MHPTLKTVTGSVLQILNYARQAEIYPEMYDSGEQ